MLSKISGTGKYLTEQSSIIISLLLLITILSGPALILSRISGVLNPITATEISEVNSNHSGTSTIIKESNLISDFETRVSDNNGKKFSILPLFISSLKVSSFSIITCGTFALMAAFIFFTFGGFKETQVIKSIMKLLLEVPNLTIAMFAIILPVLILLFPNSINSLGVEFVFGIAITLSIFPALYLPVYKFFSKVENDKAWIIRRGIITGMLRSVSECIALTLVLFSFRINGIKFFGADSVLGINMSHISVTDRDLMVIVLVGAFFATYVIESIMKKKEVLEG